MRRFSVSFALVYFAAASLRGQMAKIPSLPETLAHSDDSRGTSERTDIFSSGPHIPEPPHDSAPAGKVSVEQLRHPLSRKGEKLISKARNFMAMGEHDKAIAQLQLALKERSAIPYAHSLLGSEYLKTSRIGEAIESLEQAVKLLPRTAVNHANLGYALFLRGEMDRAEQEVRRALDLDRDNAKTRLVLGLITHARQRGE